MNDPIDAFFGMPPRLPAVPSKPEQAEDDTPAGDIETKAIAEDVDLVRKELRSAITTSAGKLDTFLELASQMQEPEMINAAAKMLTALSTLSTSLVNIDLQVLRESKKVSDRNPTLIAQPGAPVDPGERVVTEATTSEVIRLMREARKDVTNANR